MTVSNPRRQREAKKVLDELFDHPNAVTVIHYSCESFYERKEGQSPRITSIALRKLDSAQTTSFSIHQIAERNGVAFEEIRVNYDSLEREMLEQFFEHLAGFKDMKYLHWNMRDSSYGFQAIEHRFRVLCGNDVTPHVVDGRQKVDLSRVLQDIYGSDYIGHPRMQRLVEKNGIALRDFLPGSEEAKAFDDQDFAALHLSTLRKTDIIANIATRAYDRKLRTEASWWAMRGGSFLSVWNWAADHSTITFLVGVGGVAVTIFGILQSLE